MGYFSFKQIIIKSHINKEINYIITKSHEIQGFKYDSVIFRLTVVAYPHLSCVVFEPVGELEASLIHSRRSRGRDSIYEPDPVSSYVAVELDSSSKLDSCGVK